MSSSVRRTLEVAALAAVLASAATLAVSAIVTAPPSFTAPLSVPVLDKPHTKWMGMPCSGADRSPTTLYIDSGTYTGPYVCMQVAETSASMAPASLTPAEAAARTPWYGPIPPCSATSLPAEWCAAAPPRALTGADLPAGATIRVRVAGGAGEIQTCSHSKGAGVSTDGVPVSGDGWDCSRATTAPATITPAATKAPQVATADQIRAMFAGLTFPRGDMVSLREASGGIQNCSRGSGPRVNADGVSYSGDGWVCVPATAAPRTEAPYREACFGAPLDSNPQAWDCFLDERIGAGIASRVGTPPTSIQAARP